MLSSTLFPVHISNDDKLYAAVAVFRNLYDSKKDVRDVLATFINYIIGQKGLHCFNAYDIKLGLYDELYFDIPESVIKSILKKRLKLTLLDGFFTTNENDSFCIDKSRISKQLDDATNKNKCLIEDIVKYAETHIGKELKQDEINELSDSLYNLLINRSVDNKYACIVSAYIISNQIDPIKSEIISNIKEGILLYEGVKYTDNLNEIAKWDKNLTVFCDVDILFSYYGLNGLIYKELITDLMQLIDEFNIKSKNAARIKLCYFSKTKIEIESYYSKAESILENGEAVNPSKSAMVSILNGCKSQSDIVERKSAFFTFLKQKSITECNYMDRFYDNSENQKYVLYTKDIVKLVLEKYKDVTESYISDCCDYLSYINALRDGNNATTLENAEYAFLTSNGRTLNISFSLVDDDNYEISRAISPDYLINKLWFKLNKGFGKYYQSSFDIVTKARIILSSKLNSKVSESYDILQDKIKKGSMDKYVATDTLIELKRVSKNPEEITCDNIDDSIEFLVTNDSIEKRICEQKVLEKKLIYMENNLKQSTERNINNETRINEYEQKIKQMEADNEIERQIKKKKEISKKHKKELRKRIIRSLVFLFVSILIIIFTLYLGNKLSSAVSNYIVWIVGIIGLLLTILSFCNINLHTIMNWIMREDK